MAPTCRFSLKQRIFCIKSFYSSNNIQKVCRDFENEFGESIRWHTVRDLVNKFKETGSVEDKQRSGRTPSVTNEIKCKAVSEKLRMNLRASSRNLSDEFGVSQTSIVRIIKNLVLRCGVRDFYRNCMKITVIEECKFVKNLVLCLTTEMSFGPMKPNFRWTAG